MKIVFTPESIGGLSRLREFIEIKTPDAAKRIAKERARNNFDVWRSDLVRIRSF